jgi:Tfp pilus assembly protein PilF
MGPMNEALADFNNAIQIQPNYGQAYMGRAETLKKLGSAIAAQKDFKQACTLSWQEACGRVESLAR